jgi:hypothetical protein
MRAVQKAYRREIMQQTAGKDVYQTGFIPLPIIAFYEYHVFGDGK